MDFKGEKLSFDKTEKRNYSLNISAKELIDDETKLLTVTANACCNRCEMLNNEVLIEGVVSFCAIVNGENGIKKIERSERFSLNEICHGAVPSAYMFATANCEKVRGYVETGNLMLNCTVNISSLLITPCEIDCYMDIEGDEYRKLQQELEYNKINFKKNIRFSVSEDKELSPRLPEINTILSVAPSVYVKEAHITAGQLIIGGNILLQAVYNSIDEYEPIVQFTDSFDFSQIIELKDIDSGNATVKLSVEEISTNVLPDENGEIRKITYSIGLCGYVYTCETEKICVISDIYSLKNKLDCDFKTAQITQAGENFSYSTSKNIRVKLPENKMPVSRINSVSFIPSVIDKYINGSKLHVKCIGEVCAMYTVSGSGETDGFNTSVEFDIMIDSLQINDIDDVMVNLSVNDMQAILISGYEIEVRAGFDLGFITQKIMQCNIVSNVTVNENSDMPEFGIIIYNVQQGETLWDICKKYGVDVDEVKKINNDLSDMPQANKKIYIFRALAV